ncbi:hypothetical protein L6452_01193 [Arctium lappa]|uniref:Uncharacterized protein n=1 Tax=Arctium lappa TaxID=4217 RepID=A0ACB9FFZ3_ARCLA|nr:hypothetical protein L6452_01193 [Arctium lappa]
MGGGLRPPHTSPPSASSWEGVLNPPEMMKEREARQRRRSSRKLAGFVKGVDVSCLPKLFFFLLPPSDAIFIKFNLQKQYFFFLL